MLESYFSSLSNGVYKLQNNNSLEQYKVYCHMAEIPGCGEGGWTLVMKMYGKQVCELGEFNQFFNANFGEISF